MAAEHSHVAPPKRRRPWLLIIGGVLVLVSLVLCLGGGFTTFSGVQDLAEQTPRTGSHVVALEEGESTSVYSEDPTASCTATGPSGPVSDSAIGSQSVTWGDRDLERVMEVEADTGGDHTISCTAPFVVGDGFSTGGIIAAVAGGVVCALASLLILIGVILWAVRRR